MLIEILQIILGLVAEKLEVLVMQVIDHDLIHVKTDEYDEVNLHQFQIQHLDCVKYEKLFEVLYQMLIEILLIILGLVVEKLDELVMRVIILQQQVLHQVQAVHLHEVDNVYQV